MPDPLPVTALNHVALTTRRLAESRAFYRDLLGFREVERPNFDFAGAWLTNCGLTIHLIESDRAPSPEGPIDTRGNHLALHADDLDAVARMLEERGVEFRRNRIPDRNIPQVFFRDPDGHVIEVGTYPAGRTGT